MSPAAGIKPDKLLRDLADIWLVVAKPEPGADPEASIGVLRACALTLIVLVDAEDDQQALGETLAQLMRAHPSRSIVVRIKEGSDELEARVFAQCWKPAGHSQQICCEQVELVVSLNRLNDVPSIVSPLTAPDLPRVMWFRSSRVTGAPDVSALLALADKLIVDSAHPGAPSFGDLRTLATAGFVVGDLAWTRLTGLRELMAQLMEGRDTGAVQMATIEYRGREAAPEAKYLQAWLRSSLPEASVDLHKVEGEGMGQIEKIRIDPDILIEITGSCAEYRTGAMRQRANLRPLTEDALLDEELNVMRRDPVFERALQRMTIWTPGLRRPRV